MEICHIENCCGDDKYFDTTGQVIYNPPIVSVYRVHFTWQKDKELIIEARSLDMTHPYFVSIKDIILPSGKNIIINPSDDDIRKVVGKADHIMIPFQKVSLIEEIPDEKMEPSLKPLDAPKIKPFPIADKKSDRKSAEPEDSTSPGSDNS